MGRAKKKTLRGSLSKGRPPSTQAPRSMSRKASKALISSHHVLDKRRQQAAAQGDKRAEREIAAQIAALGGLDRYQEASLQGQRRDRGGDTSRVLLEWLEPAAASARATGSSRPPRMLEVGALSTQNACSVSGLFRMELIDLNSREPGILQQDFMQRPLPSADSERFDVISLSLVLNFVPDPRERGEMLRRTILFLRGGGQEEAAGGGERQLPCLFVVLPKNCITNSRYLTDELFRELMGRLGYREAKAKMTEKLAYYLWRRRETGGPEEVPDSVFQKKQVNPGRTRNNFSIVMRPPDAAA